MLRLADCGLTAFDCADIYTGVEELLGAFLQAWRARGGDRDAIRIHTKFVPDRDALSRVDRAYVERIVDRSLRRLGVERLDLIQFYWWDYDVPGWVETAGWLAELQQAGKIRSLGVTNFDTPLLRTLLDAGIGIVSNQVQYSLLDRRPERSLLALCRERQVALLCYGTLGGGFLCERWLDTPAPEGELANRSLVKYSLIVEEFGGWEALQELLRVLGAIADKQHGSIANVAVAWLLARQGVGAAIVGARTASHAEDNLRVFDVILDDADNERIDTVLGRHRGPHDDVFGLEREPGSRHAVIMKTEFNRESDGSPSCLHGPPEAR